MQRVQEQLDAYRRAKANSDDFQIGSNSTATDENVGIPRNLTPNWWNFFFERISGWIALNFERISEFIAFSFPIRYWRNFYATSPAKCMAITASFWLLWQLFFAWCEFGAVFFIFSLFILIMLSLGTRNQGEPSAYSVFNPNCERLLGQLTAEQFESELLKRTVRTG